MHPVNIRYGLPSRHAWHTGRNLRPPQALTAISAYTFSGVTDSFWMICNCVLGESRDYAYVLITVL